jgi:transketolase
LRGAFIKALGELAERDHRILFLTGDLGFMAVEPFASKFQERFINVGVAEQNMVGLATGLAEAGFIPYVYSIVPFAVLRPYEFIRNGPIANRLPVRIVGVGAGFEYGNNGISHYGLEDAGVMRIQPGITVISPADHQQTRTAVLSTWDVDGPVYYRLGKDDRTIVPGLDGRFELGRAQVIREGGDLLIVTMGAVTTEAVIAADKLANRGIESTVLVVASLNPAPFDDLARAVRRFRRVLTVETHYVVGGVGSLVAEVVADTGAHCQVARQGVRVTPDGRSGTQDFLHCRNGLSSDALVDAALALLAVDSSR